MGPIVGIREFLGMIRRRGPLVALVLAVGLVLAVVRAMSLPHQFEAMTVIQIEPTLLSVGGGESAGDTAARLRLIEQRLMSRGNVLAMIDRYNLFEDTPGLNEAERIFVFRQNARVEFIPAVAGGPGAERELSAMLITVRAGSAMDAANLANDMTDQILTSDQETRTRRLTDLIDTLTRENARITAQITQVQNQAEAFRAQNSDALPENLEYLIGELTRLETQRIELTRTMQSLDRELLALEVGADAGASGRATTVVQRLRTLEVELAQARRTLDADHPELQRLEAEIANVREGQERSLDPGTARQVALIREQYDSLLAERAALDRRLPQIEATIAEIPSVQSRLNDFARQIDTFEASRAAITERLTRAELDQRLAGSEHGERMIVLDRATPPEYPLSSGRKRVAILVLGGSVAAAVGLAFLLELRRPILRTPAQVQKVTGLMPIATSPLRPTAATRRRARWRDTGSFAILALGVVLAAAYVLANRAGMI